MTHSNSKFYYLRHHRTIAHDLEQMCGGGSDLPLVEKSESELVALAPFIQSHMQDVQVIYTTHLKRAFQSATLINGGWNKEIKLVSDLREWEMGEWERKPWKDLPHPYDCEQTPPGGEPREAFRARIVKAIDALIADDNNFLIVGHGIAFHELTRHLLGQPQYIETAELAALQSSNGIWHFTKIPYLNYDIK